MLHVRQGRVAVAGGGSVVDDPESHRSRRALPLPAEVAEALRSLKARQKKEAFALGVPWSDDRFVAVSEDGEPGRLEWFSDEFHRLRKRAGLRRIKLHALRNTSVSSSSTRASRSTSSRPGTATTGGVIVDLRRREGRRTARRRREPVRLTSPQPGRRLATSWQLGPAWSPAPEIKTRSDAGQSGFSGRADSVWFHDIVGSCLAT